MKTTKKRLVLGIAGAALLCVGAVFTTLAATAEAPITDETMLANIEALSNIEIEESGYQYCRCKDDSSGTNGCYGGNAISFRPACQKAHIGTQLTCSYYDSNCKN